MSYWLGHHPWPSSLHRAPSVQHFLRRSLLVQASRQYKAHVDEVRCRPGRRPAAASAQPQNHPRHDKSAQRLICVDVLVPQNHPAELTTEAVGRSPSVPCWGTSHTGRTGPPAASANTAARNDLKSKSESHIENVIWNQNKKSPAWNWFKIKIKSAMLWQLIK